MFKDATKLNEEQQVNAPLTVCCYFTHVFGRNLCALRWLKQVNRNGSTEEFQVYWTALSTAQQGEYQSEVERLNSTGTWNKPSDVVNGILY